MPAFSTTLNPCPRLVDTLMEAWAHPGEDATPLAVAWAEAWQATHAVFHLQARQAWVRRADIERTHAPAAMFAEALSDALERDQRCRPGLAEVWQRHGTPQATQAWHLQVRALVAQVCSGS